MTASDPNADLFPATDMRAASPEPPKLVGEPVIVKRRRLGTVGVLALTCTFGMLIWVKLRVVESVPRQAYAEPKQVLGERAPAGFKHGRAPETARQLPGNARIVPAPAEQTDQVTSVPPPASNAAHAD